MRVQIVFENEQTGTSYLFDDFPHIPRAGEQVILWDEETYESKLNGIVQSVMWSVGSLGSSGYSILITVKPNANH